MKQTPNLEDSIPTANPECVPPNQSAESLGPALPDGACSEACLKGQRSQYPQTYCMALGKLQMPVASRT